MKPYAELLEFNQPNPIRKPGFTRIRDQFSGLADYRFANGGYSDSPDDYYADPERLAEFAGRWDYGPNNAARLGQTVRVKVSFPEQTDDPSEFSREVPILQKYIDQGHESMLEMAWAAFFLECSRTVSHELVRHRPVSYQQESQRFVKYEEENYEDLFYRPESLQENEELDEAYWKAFEAYKILRRNNVAPQLARYVFPNATRTRLIMATNLREWRHICKLRLDKSAQPEMQELMQQIYDQLVDVFPNIMYNALSGERGVR